MGLDPGGIAGGAAAGAAGGSIFGPIGTVVGAGVGIAGGIIAQLLAAGDREQALRILQKARDEYGELSAPTLEKVAAQELGPSAYASIKQDPALRAEQMQGLDAFKQMEASGGLTLEDQSALNKVQTSSAQSEAAGRNAIANDFAARGQLGSAAQLGMALTAQQGAANRTSQAGMDTAADAQKRYFQAKLAGSKLAGDISQQDYQRQSDAARAADMIAAHNASARTHAADQNNANLQTEFGDRLGLASGRAQGDRALSDYFTGNANRTQSTVAGEGAAAGQAIAGVGDALDEYGNPRKKRVPGAAV